MQDDLFSKALAGRDRGMQLASDAEGEAWSQRAYIAIVKVAKAQPEVHVDDVLVSFKERPKHFNAWGSVWMRAIRNKIIEHSGTVRVCKVDPGKHAHRYPVYKSLVI